MKSINNLFRARSKISVFFLYLCLLGNTSSLAQESPIPEQLFFKRLTTDQGLSQTSNFFNFQDSRGYIWISSASGLNRFDGNEINIYREIPGDTTSIKGVNINGQFSEDKEGNLWFSTYTAVNCYNRESGHFTPYQINDSLDNASIGYYTCGIDYDNILWVKHHNELYQFDLDKKEFEFVTSLSADFQQGRFHFQADEDIKQFYFYSGNGLNGVEVVSINNYTKPTQQLFFHKNAAKITYPALRIKNTYPENDSILWCATAFGIAKLNSKSGTFLPYQKTYLNKKGEEKFIEFNDIINFNDKYLLCSTSGHGLLLFNKTAQSFSKTFKKITDIDYSLSTNYLSNLYKDPSGNIWIDVDGFSLEYTSPQRNKFQTTSFYNDSESVLRVKNIINLPNGETWIGTFGATNYIYDKNFNPKDTVDASTDPTLYSTKGMAYRFLDNQSRVWLLGYNKQNFYDLKKNSAYPVSIQGAPVKKETLLYGAQLENDDLLFGAYHGGLYTVDSIDNELNIIPHPNSPTQLPVTIFYQSYDGDIYINEALSAILITDKNLKSKAKIPLALNIKSFYENKGDSILWIGSDKGLVRLNKTTHQYRIFTENDGLPNATVYGILADDEGLFWLSTNNGIARFNPETFEIKKFGIFDGIPFLEFNTHAFEKTKDGRIIFGSLDGFVHFNPKDFKKRSFKKFPPQITDIKINDEAPTELTCNKTNASNPSEIQSLQLPYSENTLSFEFSAMDYGDPKNNQYKYRLLSENKESPWIQSGTRNFARFANIKAGQHQFQLLAANSDGNWSDQPKVLDIYIIPPLLQRTWFRILLLALFAGLMWLASRIYYNIKFQKQIALERQKLFWARKMHEDLGADYSSLKIRLGLLFDQIKGHTVSSKDTQRIKELSETVGKQIRGITWSLNYKNDTLDKLCDYLQEYAVRRFEDTGIDLSFPVDENIPDHKISGENRMTILHVFKEALNNVHKHSTASQVNITLAFDDAQASLNVKDNGTGFDPQLLIQSNGNGLQNMRERMEEIGGTCIIKTDQRGTSVSISFPL